MNMVQQTLFLLQLFFFVNHLCDLGFASSTLQEHYNTKIGVFEKIAYLIFFLIEISDLRF